MGGEIKAYRRLAAAVYDEEKKIRRRVERVFEQTVIGARGEHHRVTTRQVVAVVEVVVVVGVYDYPLSMLRRKWRWMMSCRSGELA